MARYDTKQKRIIRAFLEAHMNCYMTVDDMYEQLSAAGETLGRATVYRTLETLFAEGEVAKIQMPLDKKAYYRYIDKEQSAYGQLLCLKCGAAIAIDCNMFTEFAHHTQQSHGFRIIPAQSILFGYCAECQKHLI